MNICRCPLHCITPPHLLKELLDHPDRDVREAALGTLLASTKFRTERTIRASFASAGTPGGGRRTIYDCEQGWDITSTTMARSEDGPPSPDEAVNRVFDFFGKTREFYSDVFSRDSLDGRGMRLDGYVHYGRRYNNAGWTGREMVFGDGDGNRFGDFTQSLDVIAHELAHGVTEFTAGFVYRNEPGALNESMSDVFGSLVKQWSRNEAAEDADWLIGAEIFTPAIGGDALRSLKSPGKAYPNDPQPDHMRKFKHMPDDELNDHGGVHINSGIPNKAFYLAATAIGGFAWQSAGAIWYAALQAAGQQTQFTEFAEITSMQAERIFGANSTEQEAVVNAWNEVGVRIGRAPSGRTVRAATRARPRAAREESSIAALSKKFEAMADQVQAMAKDIASLKKK